MEKFKIDCYNPVTFKKSEVETNIPQYLVNTIKSVLDNSKNCYVTPVLYDPETKSINFGIQDNNNKNLKYKLSITPSN